MKNEREEAAAPKPTGAPERQWAQWAAIIAVLFALLLNWNATGNGFAVDDDLLYKNNAFTQKGFAGIRDILTSDSFKGYFKDDLKDLAGGRYRPLAQISFAVEKQFFGNNAKIAHVVNVLLNAALAFLIFECLRRYIFPNKIWQSLAITLLFIAHPTHTEAVANIKGRDELLSMGLLIGSLVALFRAARNSQKETLYLAVAGGTYFLALLAKENGLTFTAIAALALYFFTDTPLRKIGKYSAILMGVTVLYIALRVSIIGLTFQNSPLLVNNPYLLAQPEEILPTKLYIAAHYLRHFFWPTPLSWDFSYQSFPYYSFGSPAVWLALLVQAALFGLAVWRTKAKDPAAFGLWFYFLSISVVSGVIFNIGVFFGDRFLFQASLGLALTCAVLAARYLPSKIALLLGALVLTGFSYRTFTRNAEWKDNFTLATADAKAQPNSIKTQYAAGSHRVHRALHETEGQESLELCRESVPYFRRALAIYPKFGDAAIQLGVAYFMVENFDSAEYYYQSAKKMVLTNPTLIDTNLSKLYGKKALRASERKDFVTAVALSKQSVENGPWNALAWSNMGVFLGELKEFDSSLVAVQRAVELESENPQYRYNLGLAYYRLGRYNEAEPHWRKCVALDPRYPYVRDGLRAIGVTDLPN